MASRKRRTGTALAAAAVAGVAATALLAPAAQAAPAAEDVTCAQGAFCIYDAGDPPRRGEFTEGVYDLGGWNGGVLNDNVNWFWNLTGDNWCVYTDAGYSGTSQVVSPGYFGSLDGFGYQVSSLRSRPWWGC